MTRDIEQLRREWVALAEAADAAKKAAQEAQAFFVDPGAEVAYHAAVERWFAADDLAFEAWLKVKKAEIRRDELGGAA